MVTELPAGGGERGGRGGRSVAVAAGVPVIGVGDGNADVGEGVIEPPAGAVGVTVLPGVFVGRGVDVAGPG